MTGARIAPGTCVETRRVDQHPQLRARGLHRPVDHPVLGVHHVPGLPCHVDGARKWIATAAPTFGQHDAEVLRDIVGCTDAEIDDLRTRGIIADRPRGL